MTHHDDMRAMRAKGGDFTDVEEYFAVDEWHETQVAMREFPRWVDENVAAVIYSINTGKHIGRDPHIAEASPIKLRVSTAIQVGMQNHRARKHGHEGTIAVANWRKMLQFFKYQCAYCDVSQGTCMDHVIPLARGGKNLITNIAPACKHCNSTKWATSLDTWLERQGFSIEGIRARLATARAMFDPSIGRPQ